MTSISPNVAIMTTEELDQAKRAAYARGVERGKFEAAYARGVERGKFEAADAAEKKAAMLPQMKPAAEAMSNEWSTAVLSDAREIAARLVRWNDGHDRGLSPYLFAPLPDGYYEKGVRKDWRQVAVIPRNDLNLLELTQKNYEAIPLQVFHRLAQALNVNPGDEVFRGIADKEHRIIRALRTLEIVEKNPALKEVIDINLEHSKT